MAEITELLGQARGGDARFMHREHLEMWGMIDEPEEALAAIAATPRWREDARILCAPRR